MYDEYDIGYYEPSIMDELLDEFQQKCREILFDDINSKIGVIKHENEFGLTISFKELDKQCLVV